MSSFGVYVHVPFCAKRCDYCAFATWTDRHHLMSSHTSATLRHIAQSVEAGMPAATSVFFGGGTPSLLPGEQLCSIVAAIPVADGAEITVECNPDTVSDELFAAYRQAGVNRISFGVQSMVDKVLLTLGRSHNRANAELGVAMAKRHDLTFNLDLIYGAAGESMAQWRSTLEQVLALEPAHVSAYALTVEAGTPLADDSSRHPDDDDQADKYLLTTELFGAAGLHNYEISNWARPGFECRHNWLYWMQGEYEGFGCAAHSHRHQRRWWNVRTPERYVALSESGESTEAASDEIPAAERRIEGLQLALRTRLGVPIDSLSVGDREELRELIEERPGGHVGLTPAGRMLANEVAIRLR